MDNYSCRGYVLKALRELGYKEEEIDKIIGEITYQFDMMTEDEASDYYFGKN